MTCEEVRELLPEYAQWGPRPAGALEVHLSTCAGCTAELASYRELLSSLIAFREQEDQPPAGYLERTLAAVRSETRTLETADWRVVPMRVVAAARRRPAVASLTGAAIGVTAIGLLAWRRGRKALREAARVPELAPQ